MSLSQTDRRLLHVSKSLARDVELLKEGVSLSVTFARSIDDLIDEVAVDRLNLADEFLRMADILRRSRSDLARAAVARYYYAMYHAMRGVSFYSTRGDDHEAHSVLFDKGIPSDFPNANSAKNDLRDARLRRNEADYDPYPAASTHFKGVLQSLAPTARTFVANSRTYLRAKGNTFA
jgi:hypothetical protein